VPNSKPSISVEVCVAAFCVVLFLWLAWEVRLPEPPAVDLTIRNAVHTLASEPLTAAMKFVTRLGSGWFLWPMGILVALILEREGRRREAAVFAIAVAGGNLLNEGMKMLFHRPRPAPFFGYDLPTNFSFPSGHAFVSCCCYLALAEILIEPDWPTSRRVTVWGAAILLILCIGFSRIYLGVHYPSDVAGGYAAGVAWALAVRGAHRQRRLPTAPAYV